jgi:glycerol-3-phosphate dehydrogenase
VKRDLARLAGGTFDVLVVGGGIHGAAAARAAASRGLSTALIEQQDFGHATSANSLKIIHGGLRYLQRLDLPKIRDSVTARRAVLRRFPHLAAALPCVLPTRGFTTRGRAAMAVALALNDLLSFDRNDGVAPGCVLPRGRTIGRAELARRAPGLDTSAASGGALWYDGIALDTERLVLELALDADAAGAVVANRVRAEGLLASRGRVEGVRARDAVDGREFEIRARVTVTAAGPWHGELERRLSPAGAGPPLARAINLVVGRPIFGDTAVGVEAKRGGRLFFFVPWRGGTMIGTLYLPHDGAPGDCAVGAGDLALMVGEVNRIHPAARIAPEEVRFAHAGLLPLTPGFAARDAVESGLLKRPRVIDAARELGVEGLVGILGIKYTTGMTVGARAVELAARKIGRASAAAARPPAAAGPPVACPRGLDPAAATRLARTYGAGAAAIFRDLLEDGSHARRIDHGQPTTVAEVRHAVREEMALSLADVVLRRTPLGTMGHPGGATLAACAAIAGAELGWDQPRCEREIGLVEAEYRRLTGKAAP